MNSGEQELIVKDLTTEFVHSILAIEKETGLSNWTAAGYTRELENRESLGNGIFFKDKLIGFILLRILLPDEAEILNFAIAKSHQQKGFGKKLFDVAVHRLKSVWETKKIWLEVRESNLQARQFYEKQGFKVISKRKDFYAQPFEDALVLKLEI